MAVAARRALLFLTPILSLMAAIQLHSGQQPPASGNPAEQPLMDNSGSLSPQEQTRGQSGPKLRTAGVRGAIDSGGYSAPAAQRTQSALVASMLRVELASLKNVSLVTGTLPCSLEQSIVKAASGDSADFASNYRAAEFYLQHAKPEKALPYLEKAHRLNSLDRETVRLLAITDLQAKRAADVPALVTPFLSGKDAVDLRYLAGVAEEALGKIESAEEQFRLAADSEPSDRNLVAWGTALLMLGRADRAEEVFGRGIHNFPRATEPRIGMAVTLYSEGQLELTLHQLLDAAELDPSSQAVFSLIARVLDDSQVAAGKQTQQRLRSLQERNSGNPGAILAYASSLHTETSESLPSAQSQKIEDLLRQALKVSPNFAEAHFRLAVFLADRGNYLQAIPEYRSAIEADPGLVEAHYRLGQAYVRAGQRELAEQELAKHQELRNKQPDGEDADSIICSILAVARQPSCNPE